MKKLSILIILSLFTSGKVFCLNNDSDTGTFKICKCQLIVAGKIHNPLRWDTMSLNDFLNNPSIKPSQGCKDSFVSYFEIMFSLNGVTYLYDETGAYIDIGARYLLSGLKKGDRIIIQNVTLSFPDGRRSHIKGENIIIK